MQLIGEKDDRNVRRIAAFASRNRIPYASLALGSPEAGYRRELLARSGAASGGFRRWRRRGRPDAGQGRVAARTQIRFPIIVTATLRKEDIKDIPASVSAVDAVDAVDADTLSNHHVVSHDDLTRTVPGISFSAGSGPGLDNIAIRGVSSTSGVSFPTRCPFWP